MAAIEHIGGGALSARALAGSRGRAPGSSNTPAQARADGTRSSLVWCGLLTLFALMVLVRADDSRDVAIAAGLLLCQLPLIGLSMSPLHRRSAESAGHLLELRDRTLRAEAELRSDAAMLHEVRSTVTGIALASELLLGPDGTVPQVSKDHLTQLRDSEIRRLARLIRTPDLDDVTGVEPVHLDDLILPLVVGVRAGGGHVAWQPSGLLALGRPDDVSEVLHVLLQNAVDHAPGADIDVSVTGTSEGVSVRVSDTGAGIDAATSDIFDWGVRSPRSRGSGIGLTAARQRSNAMHGRLDLDASAVGAAFVLRLPKPPEVSCPAYSA